VFISVIENPPKVDFLLSRATLGEIFCFIINERSRLPFP
jgi:hypothetical protein